MTQHVTNHVILVHNTVYVNLQHVTNHLVLVLNKDAEFLEEGHHEDEQLKVVSVECRYQHLDDALVLHLHLDLQVFRQIQQQVERHYNSINSTVCVGLTSLVDLPLLLLKNFTILLTFKFYLQF